jgi:DAACS family dicarboxylate/amino acid:cation (Na+ or H+) symporter
MSERLPFQMLAVCSVAYTAAVATMFTLAWIAIVLGVDRFLDMCRFAVNVTGDLAAAVVVSRGEPNEIGSALT